MTSFPLSCVKVVPVARLVDLSRPFDWARDVPFDWQVDVPELQP